MKTRWTEKLERLSNATWIAWLIFCVAVGVLLGLLVFRAHGATCPYCGAEVDVTLSKPAEPAPVPRERRVFPAGVGVWSYGNAPEEMLPWMLANKMTWCQFWSGAYRSRGLPYVFQAKVGPWTDDKGIVHKEFSLDQCKAWAKYHAANAECLGVNINCEIPWPPAAQEYVDWLAVEYPQFARMSGPVYHWVNPDDPRWLACQAVMTFYRVDGGDRFAEDIWYVAGLCEALGKPYCIGVQPNVGTTGEGKIVLSRDFAAGLSIAARTADGLTVWSADRLWNYKAGRSQVENPEEYEVVMGAIAAVDQATPVLPRKRVLYPTYYYASGSEDTTLEFNRARCLGRIVGDAGFLPVFTRDAAAAEVTWDTLPAPTGINYGGLVRSLYDLGQPGRPADIRQQVRAVEKQISVALEALWNSLG